MAPFRNGVEGCKHMSGHCEFAMNFVAYNHNAVACTYMRDVPQFIFAPAPAGRIMRVAQQHCLYFRTGDTPFEVLKIHPVGKALGCIYTQQRAVDYVASIIAYR
jgi:hypothetical protein